MRVSLADFELGVSGRTDNRRAVSVCVDLEALPEPAII